MVNCVFKGTKGDKGDKGDKGAKGDKGDKGAKGDKGDKGAKGDKGDKGAKGDKGDKGAKGDKGDKGAKGDKGDKGAKGDKGDKGDKGNRGDRGDRGKDGKNGRDGRNGKNGKDGLQGPQGPKGEKGEPTKPQPISCGLILSFNPTSHVLTANLRVDKCSISASVNMRCNDQPIINKIQNTGQWIVNEILKLDFECELAETNKKIDIVNNNVIDVKSSVVSIKNDLSLISQRIINLISSVSQISTAINSLLFSVSGIQSSAISINSNIANFNTLIASVQTNLSLILNTTNITSSNVNLILNLASIIETNVETIKACCEETKDLLEDNVPTPYLDLINIGCIEGNPDYQEIIVPVDNMLEAIQLINTQVCFLQKQACKEEKEKENDLTKRIYKILGGDDWFTQGENPSITLDIEQRIRSLVQAQWGLEAEKTVEELELKNIIDVVSGFLSCHYFRSGLQEYPFNVVEDVTKKVDEDTIKKINYQSQFDEWRFKQLDALFGQFPIKIKIEDNDLIKTGDDPLEIELPNLAETLAELTGKTLFNEAMLNLLVNINFRLLNEQGSTKLQGFSTNKMVEEIVDYLGFENQKVKEKIRFLYNPSYDIKEGEQPSFEEILKETEIEVDVEECTEKQSFEQKLDQLLFSAAIIQTALYEKVNPNNLSKWGDFVKEYKDLVDAFSDDKKKEDDELDQFIEKVEEGFTGETGIIDSNNPYGRPRDQRPRIRKIGNPNSNTGGNNGGN